MSDAPQGPGWWQASDGKWYAPELHPDFQASGVPPAWSGPSGPTPPDEPASGAQRPSGRSKVIAGLVVLAAMIGALVLFLANRNGSKVATAERSAASSSTSASTARTTTTNASTTTLNASQLSDSARTALLQAAEIDASFSDQPYAPQPGRNVRCGAQPADRQVPPTVLVGTRMGNSAGVEVAEELRVYANPADATKAFALAKQAASCPERYDSSFSFGSPEDAAADVGADEAFRVFGTGGAGQVELLAARVGGSIALFQFSAPAGVDTSSLPTPDDIASFGVSKII